MLRSGISVRTGKRIKRGKTMAKILLSLFSAVVVLAGLNPMIVSPALGAEQATVSDADSLLRVGKVGPDAIPLKVWTNVPADKPAKVGEKIVIHFKAEKDCYLVVANVSSKGSVAIVFPNRETKDNRIKGGKEYTLFGKDSKLKLVLGTGVSEAKVVFYVSPEPIDLKPLKIAGKRPAIIIPATATKELTILREKVEALSKQKGFNRALLSIKSEPKGKTGLKLMGSPGSPTRKGFQPRGSSERPGRVTGTRGRGEDLKDLKKAE
jgi:hypothetical protein